MKISRDWMQLREKISKDMPPSHDSEFFSTSFASPEILSYQKRRGIKKSFLGKGGKKVLATFILIMAVLVFWSVLKKTTSTNVHSSKKTKRHLKMNRAYEIQDPSSRTYKNVEIISESEKETNKYRNHRYAEVELDKNLIKGVKTAMDRFDVGKSGKRSGYAEMEIGKKVRRGKKQRKLINELLKELGSSMRLRGVYVQSGSKEDKLGSQLQEKFHYSENINNLMVDDLSGEKTSLKQIVKSRGAPFQLPIQGKKNFKLQDPNQKHLLLNALVVGAKKHPLTIYLDFYPMEKKPGVNFLRSSANTLSDPSGGAEKHFPPADGQKGMILKLNLFPKKSIIREKGFSNHNKGKHKKKAEKKSFGWFTQSKTKKNHWKECSIVGLRPHEKHITAKWKNGNGEWIHAEHVAVKHLKTEKDSDKRR